MTFPDQALTLKKFQQVNLPVLEFICNEIHCSISSLPLPTEPRQNRHMKAELAQALLNWRFQQSEVQIVGSSTSTESGSLLQPAEIEKIWSDIDQLLTPTWMMTVPSNIGQSSHGKLKADQ